MLIRRKCSVFEKKNIAAFDFQQETFGQTEGFHSSRKDSVNSFIIFESNWIKMVSLHFLISDFDSLKLPKSVCT